MEPWLWRGHYQFLADDGTRDLNTGLNAQRPYIQGRPVRGYEAPDKPEVIQDDDPKLSSASPTSQSPVLLYLGLGAVVLALLVKL